MKLNPFRSIGGLTLHLFDNEDPIYGHGKVMMQVPREALSLLAIECINEIGMDASEALISACREVVAAVDEGKTPEG